MTDKTQLISLRNRVAQNARQPNQAEVLAKLDKAIATGAHPDVRAALLMIGDGE